LCRKSHTRSKLQLASILQRGEMVLSRGGNLGSKFCHAANSFWIGEIVQERCHDGRQLWYGFSSAVQCCSIYISRFLYSFVGRILQRADVHFSRAGLAAVEESGVDTVRSAFARHARAEMAVQLHLFLLRNQMIKMLTPRP